MSNRTGPALLALILSCIAVRNDDHAAAVLFCASALIILAMPNNPR